MLFVSRQLTIELFYLPRLILIFSYRSSRSQMLYKIGVFKTFITFTGKHLQWILLFKYSCSPLACNFIKKEALVQFPSWKFCEVLKNTFLEEYFRVTPSIASRQKCLQCNVRKQARLITEVV